MLIALFHLWLWACAFGLVAAAFIGVVRIISAIVDGPDRSEHSRPTAPLAPWRDVKPLMRVNSRLRRDPAGYRP
jgi:hypothetical protein